MSKTAIVNNILKSLTTGSGDGTAKRPQGKKIVQFKAKGGKMVRFVASAPKSRNKSRPKAPKSSQALKFKQRSPAEEIAYAMSKILKPDMLKQEVAKPSAVKQTEKKEKKLSSQIAKKLGPIIDQQTDDLTDVLSDIRSEYYDKQRQRQEAKEKVKAESMRNIFGPHLPPHLLRDVGTETRAPGRPRQSETIIIPTKYRSLSSRSRTPSPPNTRSRSSSSSKTPKTSVKK